MESEELMRYSIETETVRHIGFESPSKVQKILKNISDPIVNNVPAFLMKAILSFRCETTKLSWEDPGGWKTMLMYYNNKPKYFADRIITKCSAIGMGLRNRRKMAASIIADCIDKSSKKDPHVVCLGAGPGTIISDVLKICNKPDAVATLVDRNSNSFEYGRQRAIDLGLENRMKWITTEATDTAGWILEKETDILKMIGICEYLSDDKIKDIITEASNFMPVGSKVVVNSISDIHGNDKFFRRVLGVNLNYRTPKQIIELFEEIGFRCNCIQEDPTGIFSVIVLEKD